MNNFQNFKRGRGIFLCTASRQVNNFFDFITELPHIQFLYNYFDRERCILALIDIDDFRYINEIYGYKIGDELMKIVSKEIKNIVNDQGVVYKFNGDSFVILYNILNINEVKDNIFLLLKRFRDNIVLKDKKFLLTVSIGVYMSKIKEDIYEIVRKAEAAMYESKKRGKNQCTFFNEDIEDLLIRKGMISNQLKKALLNNEFVLLYQPIFNLRKKKIEEVEALLRWHNEELGEISPSEFIPIAEENGNINEIGYWVIEKACVQHKLWQKKGFNLKININISPVQLNQKYFIFNVKKIFKKTNVSYENVTFEITETQILKNEFYNIKVMKQLKNMGLNFAIDDFGTGYSSIKNLVNFPIKEVKIDKYFINNIKKEKVFNIIKLFIMVSHKIGYKVVAEGVENKEEVFLLDRLGCDKIQGYYISEPLDEEEIIAFLSNSSNTLKIL